MKFRWVVLFLALIPLAAIGQEEESEYDENYEFPQSVETDITLGVGLGIDYGGIGCKFIYRPTPIVGIFGSVGYNFVGAGYNGGVIIRMKPSGTVRPYASAYYGYNAALLIEDGESKTYYGPSLGAGIELHRQTKSNFWNFGIGIPIRSQDFQDDLNALQRDPRYEVTEPLPFSISIGFHFSL